MRATIEGTDLGVRGQVAALRDEGSLGRRATPPMQVTPGGRVPVRVPAPARLPREVVELRAVEAVDTLPPPAPLMGLVLEVAALADRLRFASSMLDALAANARDYEPSTLRRTALGIATAAVADLGAP